MLARLDSPRHGATEGLWSRIAAPFIRQLYSHDLAFRIEAGGLPALMGEGTAAAAAVRERFVTEWNATLSQQAPTLLHIGATRGDAVLRGQRIYLTEILTHTDAAWWLARRYLDATCDPWLTCPTCTARLLVREYRLTVRTGHCPECGPGPETREEVQP